MDRCVVRTNVWTASVLVLCACIQVGAQAAPGPVPAGTSLADWVALSEARATHKTQVIGLFLLKNAGPIALADFTSTLRTRGGEVIFAADRIGYVRARVAIDAYEALRADSRVTVTRIDTGAYLWARFPAYEEPVVDGAQNTASAEQRARQIERRPLLEVSKEKAGSAFVAARALGVSPWLAQHPTFDGRGVTVVSAEPLGEWLDHPALQRALTLKGTPVAKIGRIFASPARFTEAAALRYPGLLPVGAGEGYNTSDPVAVRTDEDGAFTVGAQHYRAPHPGAYLFQQQSLGNGNYTAVDHLYSLLWIKGARQAWVDTNEDGDFRQGTLLGDFNTTRAVGHLRAAVPPAPAAGHSLAFVLYFDAATGTPHLLADDNGHSTLTGGLLAGHNFGGGAIGSAAPHARLDAVYGRTVTARSVSDTLEAVLVAAAATQTDLVSASMYGGDEMADSPHAFAAQFLDRVVTLSRKPQFWAALNFYAKTASVVMPSVAEGVMSVGAYVDAATLNALGYPVGRAGFVAPYSYGPSNAGQMKPDFIAPMGGITTAPLWTSAAVPAGRLPPGYAWAPGTSCATPAAAAVAADLISGAKQSGLPYDAARIYWALKASAHYLPEWPAQSQGAGLISLVDAWELLTRAAHWPPWRFAPQIEVRAPVRTRWVEYTHETTGSGLFEREGWRPGDEGDRTLVFTRRRGPASAHRYSLRWLGNDGTFRIRAPAQNELSLALNTPTSLQVHIGPIGLGAHTATLALVEAEEQVPVAWTAFTVIAAAPLTADNVAPFSVDETTVRDIAQPGHHFIQVPTGTQALKVEVDSATGRLNLIVNPPLELDPMDQRSALERVWEAPSTFSRLFRANDDPQTPPPRTRTYWVGVPKTGVWEFILSDHTGFDLWAEPFESTYRFRATALAANLSATWTEAGAIAIRAQNTMGPLESARLRVETGRRHRAQLNGNTPATTFEVPTATPSLWLRGVRSNSLQPARLWVYVKGTSSGAAGPALLEVPFEARPNLTVRRPQPGLWTITADASDLREGPVELEILATSVEAGGPVLGAAAPRRSGETWRETLPVPPAAPGGFSEGERTALVELDDVAADDSARGAGNPPRPQRPLAIGQVVVSIE